MKAMSLPALAEVPVRLFSVVKQRTDYTPEVTRVVASH
jgi:hypothetical protein